MQGSGKFEDLIVSSHEIAASTAQLVSFKSKLILHGANDCPIDVQVAASKVKASLHSERLVSVKAASRSGKFLYLTVNVCTRCSSTVVAEATAGVVASAKSGSKMNDGEDFEIFDSLC